jgi:hypothetical protein
MKCLETKAKLPAFGDGEVFRRLAAIELFALPKVKSLKDFPKLAKSFLRLQICPPPVR